MYSEEIGKLLADNNYVITQEQYEELSPQKNIQISRLYYDTGTNTFHLYTYDGYSWEFRVERS